MHLDQIDKQCFILSLFVRDDGERFLLGSGGYEFKEAQQHFTGNSMVNDTVEIQGNDGVLLAGQVRRAATQEFAGYIGDFSLKKTEIERLRREFIKFFAKNHFYSVIYIFNDGTAIKRQRGFLIDAPEVKEIWQMSPEYSVALNFEDVNYYRYLENPEGEEIYSQTVEIQRAGAESGGLVWDEVGIVWHSYGDQDKGAEWEEGSGEGGRILVDSISDLYPVITLGHVAVNPTIENLTTGTKFTYNGTTAAGQVLVVDGNRQTVKLNGLNVLENFSGDWIRLAPGINRLVFTTESGSLDFAIVEWSEIVG